MKRAFLFKVNFKRKTGTASFNEVAYAMIMKSAGTKNLVNVFINRIGKITYTNELRNDAFMILI